MRIKIALATAVAALVFTPATPAHAIPANCQAVPWGFLGSQVRAICDGPILTDGSWMRHRVVGVPAHTEYPHSSCTSSTYSSNCTYYPGGYVPEVDSDDEWYAVRPETVLPDEPGHLP